MYDHSDSAEKKSPQTRPLFAPKPDVPRGRNLIGDNPFYNYLGKPPVGTPLTTPKTQPWYSPSSTIKPNVFPIYGGASQYYKTAADKLWNAPNYNLQALNPLDVEQNKAAQSRIKDFIGKHNLKILTNPNEAYQNKKYLDETFDTLLHDPRLERFYDIFRLERQNAQQERDEFYKLKEEEAELEKKYNDYATFKDELHSDLTNLMKQDSDTNLLLEPNLEKFPEVAKYLQISSLTSSEYDKIFNTRKEGFWDKFFGSGTNEADDIEKIYKGLRLFSKKPKTLGKFLEGIENPHLDWIKKHYILGTEEGGSPFDSDIKYAINQLHTGLLEKNRGAPDEKKVAQELEKWQDETVKNIFKANVVNEAAENFADKLTEFLQINKKLPKTLGAQPKAIDLNNFILGSKELNNYLYQFLKNNPYGDWKENLRKDLQTTFLPYYNQDLVFGDTIDNLLNTLEDKIRTAGGVEKFLIDNIKHEKGGAVSPSKTPENILKTLKERVDYLKGQQKKKEDNGVVEKIITNLSPEIKKEVIKQASNIRDSFRISNDLEGEIKFGSPEYEGDVTQKVLPSEGVIPEKEIDLNNIQDIYNLYNQFKSGHNNIVEIITNAFNKFKTYTDNKYEDHKVFNLEREKQREQKFEKAQEYFNNAIQYVEDKYRNLPTDEIKANIDSKLEQFKDYAETKFEETRDYLAEKRGTLKEYNQKEIEEKDRKYEEAIQDITKNFEQVKNYAETQYKNFKTDFPPKFAATYSQLQTYLEGVLQDLSKNLSPQTEEKILNNFAYQNEYIEESLSMDIDSFVEVTTDILTDELSKQDLAFDPEKLKGKIEESIKPFIIDDVIIKNETIIDKAKLAIEQDQSEIKKILSEETNQPIKVEDELITTLQNISNTLGEVDFITQEMINKEAEKQKTVPEEVKKEIIEAINNKPIEELKPIEKIYYNDTLVNEQVKKLEEELAEKTGEYLKLNGNKEADLIIDSAQQVYDDVLARKAQSKYHQLLKNKYTIEQINILKPLKKEIDAIGKSSYSEKLGVKSLLKSQFDMSFSGSAIPSFYVNEKLSQQQQQYFLKQSLEKAKQNNDIEEVLALDYLDNFLKNTIKNYEQFLTKNPEAFKQIKEILNQAQPLMEKKILDGEIKPGLTNYINTPPSTTNDLKTSIKELGNVISGLSEEQLHKAIQNLPEEDRNKLINKVTDDLNVLLDAVKEYAPEVMESFNKLVEAQKIDDIVQNYQVSPETLQAVENKINTILGEKGLTKQAAADKIIETTGDKGLQEIENKITELSSILKPLSNQYTMSNDIIKAIHTFTGKHNFPVDTSEKKSTFGLLEIDKLLRILYPIFKNMGTNLNNYDIQDPNSFNYYGMTRPVGFPVMITNLEGSADYSLGNNVVEKYLPYVQSKFEELKNAIKNLPNFPDWLAKSTFEPNLEKAVKIAEEHDVTDPVIDEFIAQYKKHQEAMKLIRQRMEELYKIHSAFVSAESNDDDDSIWGSVLGAVLGAVAAFATPWGAGILTPSILAGTATGTVTSVTLGAVGGATLGGTVQGLFGDKEYHNSGEVRNDIGELDHLMKEYYEKSNEAQTKVREKIIELGTKKE